MPKRHLDPIDLAAEREGVAVAQHRQTINRPFGHGKRIQQQRRAHMDGSKRIECRILKQTFDRIRYA